MLQTVASLINDARVVIYDHNMFIIQAPDWVYYIFIVLIKNIFGCSFGLEVMPLLFFVFDEMAS